MNMRQGGPGGRRPRSRHHGSGPGNGGGGNGGGSMGGGPRPPRSAAALRHQTFDSNGPDVRVRGNAWQVHEKYLSLARDAQGSGDRVLAESYLQHAEHYYRVTEAINEATAFEQQKPQMRGGTPQGGQTFGEQQPDVPSNYYTQDGQLIGAPQPQTQPEGQPPVSSEAEIQRRTPPVKAPDPFLPRDDEDGNGSGLQRIVSGN